MQYTHLLHTGARQITSALLSLMAWLLPAATLALTLLALATLGACSTIYPDAQVDFPVATAPTLPASGPTAWEALQPVAQTAPATPVVNGSIYQAAQYRPLFEDHRARMVGDTLTVQITEKVDAKQSGSTSVNRSAGMDASAAAFPLLTAAQLARLNLAAKANNNTSGKGAVQTAHNFSGTITATVIGVLANGHLIVAGEKQIGVNHNVEVLRFTGQVDPRSILPGNTVPSVQVANVRVEQTSRGAQGDAQAMGWFSRYFLNLMPL